MPKTYKHFKFDDGRTTSTAYFDGYAFGDTLLEGVIFKAEILPSGALTIEVIDGMEYFQDLNTKKWMREAMEYAAQAEEFSETKRGGEDLILITQ